MNSAVSSTGFSVAKPLDTACVQFGGPSFETRAFKNLAFEAGVFGTGGPGPSLDPVRQWRIHIGAHETASPDLRRALAALRPELAARGVDAIPRAVGFAEAMLHRPFGAWLPLIGRRATARRISAPLEMLRRGPDTLVLSEDRLLGSPRRAFSEPFYPLAGQVAQMLATLAGPGPGRNTGRGAEVTLFLSIRGFQDHLPAIYARELRALPPPAGGFDAIKRRVLARPPSWFDLVRRLRAAAPGVTLRVWRSEDYAAHPEAILSAFIGCDTGAARPFGGGAEGSSSEDWPPPVEAVREAEALPADLAQPARRALVEEIFAAAGPGTPFRPFSTVEQGAFEAAYAADVERIAALGQGILIRP